jgi:hypothetical protein
MTTIVTAFLTNINKNINRTFEKYIEYGTKLINIPQQKIIYIEKEVYNKYYKDINDINTTFRFIEKKDIYLYEYYDQITNFNLISNLHEKDSIEYIFVQCNKTEWIKNAINENPYNSEQFIWIDFGIYHVINNDELFIKYINHICKSKYDNIRIAHGYFNGNEDFIYRQIIWFFLGGIFGGHKDKLLLFADLMKDKCLSIIKNEKTICWEINIWYLIYKEHSELFSIYSANHNISILENY